MTRVSAVAAGLFVLFAHAAVADDAATAPAKKAVTDFLTAATKKKWKDAQKLVHPKQLENIAQQDKKLGPGAHPLGVWSAEKQTLIQKFEVGAVTAYDRGAFVVRTTEDHFSVEEKGVEEGLSVEYVVLVVGGTAYVTDRRIGEDVFPAKTLAASYKGYFDGEYEPPAAPAKKPGKKGK